MRRSPATIRRVWGAISRTPQASVRALARQLQISSSGVSVSLCWLRDAGYISYRRYSAGARRIIIPLLELELEELEQAPTSD